MHGRALALTLVFVLALALALASCTTVHLVKPGATVEDFQRDSRECQGEAQVLGPISIESRYRDCLLARGYRPH